MKCIEITLAITALRTLHVVPNKHFHCLTLIKTDTYDVFFCTQYEGEWLFNLYSDIFYCFLFISGSTSKFLCVIISVSKTDKQKNIQNCSAIFPLHSHYFRVFLMFFAASMFLPYLRFRVASVILGIPSCLAHKDCLATSLPINSSSLVRYRCSPYNL